MLAYLADSSAGLQPEPHLVIQAAHTIHACVQNQVHVPPGDILALCGFSCFCASFQQEVAPLPAFSTWTRGALKLFNSLIAVGSHHMVMSNSQH